MDRPNDGNTITLSENSDIDVGARLRAVSYFSLQSYCKRNPSMRAASGEVENYTDFKRKGGLQAVFVGAERAIWISGYPAFFNKLNSLDIFAESILVLLSVLQL